VYQTLWYWRWASPFLQPFIAQSYRLMSCSLKSFSSTASIICPMAASEAMRNRVSVLLRKVEGLGDKVGVFLHAFGRQNDRAVVAVAAAAGHLPVIAPVPVRCRPARADAHDVDDDGRQIHGDEVRDALLLEGEARPEELVMALAPAAAAPSTMLMPESSDSA
jgi:hypothetical protein